MKVLITVKFSDEQLEKIKQRYEQIVQKTNGKEI